MYSAKDIALWFIYKTNAKIKENIVENDSENYEVYEGITHLKLQKLLYFSQGISLAIYDKPLFSEKIFAWEHGPVIKEVYTIYKEYGRNYIEIKTNKDSDKIIKNIELDQNANKILNIVYDNFAIYTAWQLRDMTHVENGPWDQTKSGHIKNDIIKTYFKKEIIEG